MVATTNLVLAFSALALAAVAPGASAGAFLRMKTHEELQQVTLELLESTLLSELAADTPRLKKFESELQAMYISLPKNEHGTLEPITVRYALHRYFVQKHGWYVKGLEPAGKGWNSSSPTSLMKSRVPAYIESLFEQHLHGQGMALHDLAVFVATLSDFVHNEALSDTVDLYSAFNLPTTEPVRKPEVDRVIKAYVLQLLHSNDTIESMRDLREMETDMTQNFPAWGDFKLWVEDLRKTLAWQQQSRQSLKVVDYTMDRVIAEVQEVNDRLGAFQDIECKEHKAALMDIEYKSTGRVLLSDFYRLGFRSDFLFNEHADYLRELGALDESDPLHLKVIITNYLASQANCLASTSFHSVCCFDECQGLMGHMERSIAAPRASPDRIAEVVAGLRSDTVDAPRNLSESLMSRLAEIAEHHSGIVPLHGRLFAQWMHHAYPLECSYPHAAGTTSPLTPDDWMDATGLNDIAATVRERQLLIKDAVPEADTEVLPWTAEEELVVSHNPPTEGRKGPSIARTLAAFAGVMALAVPIAKASATLVAQPSQAKCDKHLV